MSEELKPCPFCGSTNLGNDFTARRDQWWVDCYSCGESSKPRASKAESIAAWNRRAASREVQEGELEALIADVRPIVEAMKNDVSYIGSFRARCAGILNRIDETLSSRGAEGVDRG